MGDSYNNFSKTHHEISDETREKAKKACNPLKTMMYELMAADYLTSIDRYNGEICWRFEGNKPNMTAFHVNKSMMIFAAYKTLLTAVDGDIEQGIAALIAFHTVEETTKKTNIGNIEEVKPNVTDKSKEEVEVMRQMFLKNPEEMAEIMKQVKDE